MFEGSITVIFFLLELGLRFEFDLEFVLCVKCVVTAWIFGFTLICFWFYF